MNQLMGHDRVMPKTSAPRIAKEATMGNVRMVHLIANHPKMTSLNAHRLRMYVSLVRKTWILARADAGGKLDQWRGAADRRTDDATTTVLVPPGSLPKKEAPKRDGPKRTTR